MNILTIDDVWAIISSVKNTVYIMKGMVGMSEISRNIAVLLGSPRRDGNSERLATAFAHGASEAGYKVTTLRMTGLKVGGCIDCRRCWSNGKHCFINDDMQTVYEALDDASTIVFATPLYFYSWSTQIKPVWDRLLPYFSENSKVDIRGRRAVLLATAGDDDSACFDGLKKSFELACGFCKWDIAGTICATDVYKAGEISEKGDWLQRAEALGRSM